MKQKEILAAYFNNERDRLEEDVRQLQQRLRYRNADAVDCLELSLALERLTAFDEFVKSTRFILRMELPEPVTYVSINTPYAKHRVDIERNKGK